MYRIFSLSKAITATAIMLLIQKGNIKLTDNIGFGKLTKIQGYKDIKIIDLLNHKSGLFDAISYVFLDKGSNIYNKLVPNRAKKTKIMSINNIYNKLVPNRAKKTKIMSINDIIYIINKYSDSNDPISINRRTEKGKFKYNNTNYDILGYIIQYITKGNTYKFIRDNIFDPLCMDANFISETNNTTIPYQSSTKYGVLEQQGEINGNANIVSTLRGYYLFLSGYNLLMTKSILKEFQNLYFFRKIGKRTYFYATGSGDFPTYGKYKPLSKSVAVYDVDKGTVFIACQNYMGKKLSLIFRQVSFRTTLKDYENLYKEGKMKTKFKYTIFGIIMNKFFPNVIK